MPEQRHKCAHPSCTCLAAEGSNYCSQQCETAKGAAGECRCSHAGCKGRR